MAESSQPSPDNGGGTPPADPKPAADTTVDLTKLEGDDLKKVLENPNLFKLPRIADALKAEADLKKLRSEQDKQTETQLAEQKKWEELANKRGQENETLHKQIQDSQINAALSTKLYGEQVVDLDGALKLIDKSKISVDDNGQIQGIDDAIASLKTDKGYLFTTNGNPRVGNPSNPSAPPTSGTGRYKFKESQLTPEFYKANEKEINEAAKLGLIEADGPPQ